ncbi:MAG: dihydropteroate synthase, partial [Lachnospiraceae bacterium]|nr:dihydropteroate synthase [Lachnospiraceae bacterium]
IEQVEAGAEILDVNVGAPGIDEKAMMIRTVKALQSIVDVPLQLDSTKPDVLEAALRIYNGKPIINSVNGEDAVLDRILPLAAKYGAAVIGLTLDENGIPPKAEERMRIAGKILDRAKSYGIRKEDVIIDCLVLTVSAEQKAALETLKAVRMVKEQLGLRTVLGVSNISFGLPNRTNINTSFLTMALYAGLDLPIMNPNLPAMMWTIKSYRVLAAIDENSLEYISYSTDHTPADVRVRELTAENEKLKTERESFAEHPTDCTCPRCQSVLAARMEWLAAKLRQGPVGDDGGAVSRPFRGLTDTKENPDSRAAAGSEGMAAKGSAAAQESAESSDLPRTTGILKAMETGMKKDGRRITAALLRNTEPMSIINDILIPSLDTIGERFEKGKLFLPQLILAADVASECFDEIKTHLAKDGNSSKTRGRIILATVKGDIHDIGKNIVKVILENYGYEIIDLGRDVDPELILETAVSRDVKLVGLSALMTTTLGAMEKTIRLLRENNVDCRIMVGGAVLTPDYAKRIGADYYAKDAKTGADIAKEVFG